MRTVHLSAISHVLGEARPIGELGDAVAELAHPDHGLAYFRSADQEICELAEAACVRTASLWSGAPDLVLYVSENDGEAADTLARLAQAIGLPGVSLLAVSGHGCGNLGPALRTAAAALHAGEHDRVLLVLADRALPGERLMRSGLSVFSDSAAACVITREPEPADGFQAEITAVVTKHQADRDAEGRTSQSILGMAELAEAATADVLRRTNCTPDEFDHVVLANYRIVSQRFLVSAMGVPARSLMIGPVGDLGHCFSADLLISMDSFAATGRIKPGDRLLAAATGTSSWSTMALEVTRT
ncbi:MAG TPA: 3-oxoacyl-[acyl-carrier-protein] synthase III C-terminal domain-containing protein [Actinocrinis sp.]|uniref:3-oxoacyl-[acyl-carrier-protein] synthase III C-terminal domain-containing protein n=1 Tax=Actinocrinis sp. TaxID=1920516 RepID=UPI002DDDA060|nr:3-oxoacyl-[acyl-carrier-protein] synthase III C-terminal domain-containing protein [Actinocrinis sp.]HEV2343298.1 3-oxoacyl-[acyl-carrier-protein] synthase III C-terminal domain-containing protein [Actinocrinis sp.]